MRHSEETKRRISESKKGSIPWNKGIKFLATEGEKNGRWKEKPSYAAIHQWLVRKLGKAEKCSNCPKTKSQGFKIEWANIDHKYRRSIEDYNQLCTSCHRKFDIESNNYNIDPFKFSKRS